MRGRASGVTWVNWPLVPAPMWASLMTTGAAHWLEMSVRRGLAGQS
jgi:hypothetical protein